MIGSIFYGRYSSMVLMMHLGEFLNQLNDKEHIKNSNQLNEITRFLYYLGTGRPFEAIS